MTDRVITAAIEALAKRTGRDPDTPEVQIAANALLGLWDIHYRSPSRCPAGGLAPTEIHETVTAGVHRAARVIDAGLAHSF
jgi:hypothetical protein